MNKKTLRNILRSFFAMILVALILFGVISNQPAQSADFRASYIKNLQDSINVNYKDYIDSSVMYKLPEAVKADDDISVIITLSVDNLLDSYNKTDKSVSFSQFALTSSVVQNTNDKINAQKDNILSKLNKNNINYSEGEVYNTVLSGFELVIKARDFESTCKSLDKGQGIIVGEVYNVCETTLVENKVNVFDTGIFNSQGAGYDGSGMVVAVLDTGLDSGHSAFSVKNFTSKKLGLTYEQVRDLLSKTTASKLSENLGVDDVYINEKVPFGYDYADNDTDVYSTHNNHGTHVSGVIVGKDDVITGVAPNAQLVSMKIFSDVVDTARTAWILAALEDCVVLGVDVINMSIGTACGFSRETDEEAVNGVYQRVREAGISMVVAASNSYSSAYGSEANGNLGLTSNPDTGTVGSPSTYNGVMSVASINGTKTPYLLYNNSIIYFIESSDASGQENNFFETLLGDKKSQEFDFVTIPGVGRSADYTGLDVKGKIVLVRRGSNTFEEKALIAEAQGAAGIIVYNNVSGDIKMNVGDANLAVCSISQDDGEILAKIGSGKLKISVDQTSGPFMSDFSSWGPTPSLGIKPEITAHGGNILSSITGGGYDRISGTSMACPNLAGVTVLLRQYVVENFPEIANDNVEVNALVSRLMMSTADIIINKNNLPYAVRKQGAGLANLLNSINTKAYIKTFDTDGNVMDKTKLELGDDPEKTGEYTLSFSVVNFGSSALTYNFGYYVMTEGVSDTKTSKGETTVTEEAYLLSGAKVEIISQENAVVDGKKITIAANTTANLTVKITLSDKDKAYMDKSFENGMYIEGFITLDAVSGTDIDLNVPYLAFYGDWTIAPLFDLDYYETNADELDDSIPVEDKTMPDAYASRPVGGVSEDYVSFLGSYYFLQDPDDIVISANRDYIALSNQEGTIHSLRFVWAGLLRNATKIVVTITDDTTGEVIFETVDTDVRKSYGDGGSIYPANIEIEFDTMDYNLANNTEYTVSITGYLDYEKDGITSNEKNTFTFPLTVDFQAPTVSDVEFYYEYDKTAKKNRLYAKVAIYDNHYAMSSQIGYVTMGEDENGNPVPTMVNFEQYMTPVYSQHNSTTYVTYELTDYLEAIKKNATNKNSFTITCYDYALNYATYEIGMPDNYVDFYFKGLEAGLTLSPNEVYSLEPSVYPNTEWSRLLEYSTSKPSVVRVVNDKLVAVSSGSAIIKARDPSNNKSVTFNVTVLKEGDDGYRKYDKPVADVFTVNGYTTVKAFYMVNSSDKLLGDDGNIRFFENDFSLSMYPSESVSLNYTLDAFFPKETTVAFESGNDSIVKINEQGVVTAVSEGFSSVTVKVMQDGKSTYYSQTITIEVKDPYVNQGATLTHYYGNGGLVTIPDRLSLKEIGAFAFSNFNYVPKTAEELAFDDAEAMKQWFIGDNTITKVIVPEGVEKISQYAFANLTALEEVVLPSTLESIEYGAFYNCTRLEKITFSGENNLIIISQNAFEKCNLKGTLEFPKLCVISDYAFAGNINLEGIKLSDKLWSVGKYAFAGCKSLKKAEISSSIVKYGEYAFTGCKALKEFVVKSAVLPTGMFYECEALESVTLDAMVNDIGEFAFLKTSVNSFNILEGNKAYKVQNKNYIISSDEKTLVAISPLFTDNFTKEDIDNIDVEKIEKGAFSHNNKLSSVTLKKVTYIGEYALASSKYIENIDFGNLTYIGNYAFFETSITKLPSFTKDTVIGKYAFAYTQIKEVNIPDGMTISEGAFSECLNLEKITIGNNVTLEKYAFNLSKDLAFKIEKDTSGKRNIFYYVFYSPIKSITIGNNAIIGDNAFGNASSVEKITLGDNAKIGYMAFYNAQSLKEVIGLDKAIEIGGYAFSGDVYYSCYDQSMTIPVVTSKGQYQYSYHAPMLKQINLMSANSIGINAFSYCRQLTSVVLNPNITEVPEYAFAGCISLNDINLENVVTIGGYAFIESSLDSVDLSKVTNIGEYAFVYSSELNNVVLNTEGVDIGEGAFSYCTSLDNITNINKVINIDAYAFAYTGITSVDLSSAVSIGDRAFLKEELTPFTVILGSNVESIGDNPFGLCIIEPFYIEEVENFNGVDFKYRNYTYNINDNVRIINGSLYCKLANGGLELITYAGIDSDNAIIADGTVRITSMAFTGSNVRYVTIPYTVKSIGHKAFYMCENLKSVIFTSYKAPILEEEFDNAYYESFEHIPGTGDYGTYEDYDGNTVQINGIGLNPYYMWNVTGSMYSNVFYGATFVDYVGYVEDKLLLIRPVNGIEYSTYIIDQYFDTAINGAAAADDVTLNAIDAINRIPERVTYEDKAYVEAAREAYNKIATTVQQSLVTNYATLISAEQRIIALTPENDKVEDPGTTDIKDNNGISTTVYVLASIIILITGIGVAAYYFIIRKKGSSIK